MMPNKILITIVGVAMIGMFLYPPTILVATVPSSGATAVFADEHQFLWKFDGQIRPDFLRLALYEVAIAGVGALIHFLTRK